MKKAPDVCRPGPFPCFMVSLLLLGRRWRLVVCLDLFIQSRKESLDVRDMRPGRRQLQILVAGIHKARRRDKLPVSRRGDERGQPLCLEVISICLGRIGCDRLVRRLGNPIHLARRQSRVIERHRLVEVVLRGTLRVCLGRRVIGIVGILRLAQPAQRLPKLIVGHCDRSVLGLADAAFRLRDFW